jgi:hypothetical protein
MKINELQLLIGGRNLRYIQSTLKTMTTSFINEITDQELQLVDLHDMNGGFIGILLLSACEDDDEESSSQTTSTTSSSTSGTQSIDTTSSTTWLNWMEKATVGNKYHPSINPNGKK